jgi:hypothetical protein
MAGRGGWCSSTLMPMGEAEDSAHTDIRTDLDGLCWISGLLRLFIVTEEADHQSRGMPSSSLKGTSMFFILSLVCVSSSLFLSYWI